MILGVLLCHWPLVKGTGSAGGTQGIEAMTVSEALWEDMKIYVLRASGQRRKVPYSSWLPSPSRYILAQS